MSAKVMVLPLVFELLWRIARGDPAPSAARLRNERPFLILL